MFKEKQMKATLSLKSMTWIFIDVEWKKKQVRKTARIVHLCETAL